MKLKNSTAEIFVPDGLPLAEALGRITHLGIGAHQDDLEFMAFHGIIACHRSSAEWFGGVTCTNGAGSARAGSYANFTHAQMRAIRREEQNQAARIGCYGVMIQLDHPSQAVKAPKSTALREDLIEILHATRPRVVYTHNLADKHDTHLAVTVAAIEAMRALPRAARPETVHGCEMWRDLDWMEDTEKIVHDLTGHDSLAAALKGVFESQIAGGKRYDLGVAGRRRANATFFESHAVDRADSIAFAMDLTPLVRDASMDIDAYADGFIERFRANVRAKLRAYLEGPEN
ncbi:MAG: PIG-L family deacetylase [Verrucomicrobiota bacterium]|nr:PIG-L family deacetylase [Verrucomicrobiota bacterium]